MEKEQNENLEKMRHTLAHILMQALEELHSAIPAIGPVIENGFYHDFDAEVQITDKDLKTINREMIKIINKDLPIEKKVFPIDEGIKLLEDKKYIYTLELAKELKEGGEKEISFYQQGDFINMCNGPHLESTGKINPKAFKLNKISGVYWRGDDKNKMLQRIYGVAFESPEELKDYEKMMEEALKRDHRKLGKELDLFSISQKVGAGLILWHPKLSKTREVIESFWRKFHRQRGYDAVYTPHIGRSELWETSGHLKNFKEMMYSPMDVDGEQYYIKPMNCPFHVEIYKSSPRSWRDFPFRWNELGAVYRYEKSGELAGMLRVRGFTQDDAHIICRKDQFIDEYREVLKFTIDILEKFGFKKENIKAYIATRDPKLDKYLGTDEIWDSSEKIITEIIKEFGIPNEVEEGGAKFYGPAIDLKIKDSIGREWQLTTIQLDFNLPEKFDMTYQGKEGKERPIMIHRALLGSLERFIAILIEHYGGNFPFWLAPLQVKIIPVADEHNEYAQNIFEKLRKEDFRAEIDTSDNNFGKKVREAKNEKVPYFVVVGDDDIKNNKLTLESRDGEDSVQISLEELFEKFNQENKK
ncbi:MAG: threonine--tRNA ligase [Candidatus Pacebacteria bacterium]|nr:threonine--tRNA ligase [Candidatus Paceibacterota bacterium]